MISIIGFDRFDPQVDLRSGVMHHRIIATAGLCLALFGTTELSPMAHAQNALGKGDALGAGDGLQRSDRTLGKSVRSEGSKGV